MSASLAELMGKAGANKGKNMTLDDLHEVLGEDMPELPRTRVGRRRLVVALQQRFGDGFRAIPGVKNVMKEFDEQAAFDVKVQRMKMLGKG